MKKMLIFLLWSVTASLFAQTFTNASDFTAGSKPLFNDQLNSDRIGEFPSGWTFGKGTIETAMLDNQKVIEFKKGGSWMEPGFKNFDYLPQDFSVEFDYYLSDMTQRGYHLNLYTGQRKYERLEIRGTYLSYEKAKGTMERKSFVPGWKRMSISYKDGTLKGYVNGERVLNYPGLNVKFAKLTLAASDGDQYYIKNFRIGSYSGQEGGSQVIVPQQNTQAAVKEEPVVTIQPKIVSTPVASSGISSGSGASGNLTVVNAWWGSPLDGQRIDVTDLLNKKILFGKLTAIASNPFLNANLPKGEDKNLYIRYKTPVGEYEITVIEGEKTTIPDINRHRKAK